MNNWFDIVKDSNYWDRFSIKLAKMDKGNSRGGLNIVNSMFRKLIYSLFNKKEIKELIDECARAGLRDLLSLISFWQVQMIRKPHSLLPDKILDLQQYGAKPWAVFHIHYLSDSFSMKDVKKYPNFEGWAVEKIDGGMAVGEMYRIYYISNGFIFQLNGIDKPTYKRVLLNYLGGQRILELRNYKREQIPLRKITARGT